MPGIAVCHTCYKIRKERKQEGKKSIDKLVDSATVAVFSPVDLDHSVDEPSYLSLSPGMPSDITISFF